MQVGDVVGDYRCVRTWVQPNGRHGLILMHVGGRWALIIGRNHALSAEEATAIVLEHGTAAEEAAVGAQDGVPH